MSSLRSFVFFDKVVTLDGGRRLYQNWDFVTKLPNLPEVPRNWVAPVNYRDGTFLLEAEVRSMGKVASTVRFAFGWWNFADDPEIRHIAIGKVEFSAPGTYSRTGVVRDVEAFFGKGPRQDQPCHDWNWEHAFADDLCYVLLNPRDNNPETEGFPYTIRARFTVFEKAPA